MIIRRLLKGRKKLRYVSPAILIVTILVITPLLGADKPSEREPVKLTEKDAGSSVELRTGDMLEVVLDGNPTTGYLWEMAPGDRAVVKPVGESEFKAETELIGAGGKITLQFEAVAPGQTVLKLIYHRTFEKDVPPIKTFEVTVIVQTQSPLFH